MKHRRVSIFFFFLLEQQVQQQSIVSPVKATNDKRTKESETSRLTEIYPIKHDEERITGKFVKYTHRIILFYEIKIGFYKRKINMNIA